jgi:hypothetical protein
VHFKRAEGATPALFVTKEAVGVLRKDRVSEAILSLLSHIGAILGSGRGLPEEPLARDLRTDTKFESSIDEQLDSCDEAAVLRCEEYNGFGDPIGSSEPAEAEWGSKSISRRPRSMTPEVCEIQAFRSGLG